MWFDRCSAVLALFLAAFAAFGGPLHPAVVVLILTGLAMAHARLGWPE